MPRRRGAGGTGRSVTIAGSPIKLTNTPTGVRHRAPIQGEHTDELLREIGVSDAEIAQLREDEVVR